MLQHTANNTPANKEQTSTQEQNHIIYQEASRTPIPHPNIRQKKHTQQTHLYLNILEISVQKNENKNINSYNYKNKNIIF